uniref:Uncharacterized protein n=1 Tax=Knipowitschia caucasica TaxID=637954 RepID=A0AAV2JS09_KNICA
MNHKEHRTLRRALEREQAQSQTNAEDAGEEVQQEVGPSTSNMEPQVQQEQPEVHEESTNQNPTDRSREEIDRLKLRVQMEYEERYKAHVIIATMTSQHTEQLKAKDAIIRRLRKGKNYVFSGLHEKAQQAVQDEIRHQATANSFLRGQVESLKSQNQANVQSLQDQISILNQELKKEQEENKNLKSSLEIMEALERERQQLTTEVSGLKRALGDNQTLQQEKVDLQSAVKDLRVNLSQEKKVTDVLRSKVNDLSHKIQEQEEISQALNQKVITQTSTFRTAIERCQTAITCAAAQKDQLAVTVDNTKQEMEVLKLKHSDEMSAEQQQRSLLQERIEELSKALSASDLEKGESAIHSATVPPLPKQRLELQEALRAKEELQETLRTKEEELQETTSQKRRRVCCGC